jgi:processive 1,2-diacylglycerol beta-glucosyltransferase
MKKILILTASYGEGHNAAARGLDSAFREIPTADAEVLDLFGATYGAVYDRTRTEYLNVIERAPKLWAAMYGILDRTPLVHAITPMLNKVQGRLSAVLDEKQPAAVIATYPIYNYLLNRIRTRKVQRPFRQYTVVTDSITVNSVWFRSDTDAYFVPNDETALAMKRAGVPAEKLRVFGFPVPHSFASRRPERPDFGEGKSLRVLYMINGGKEQAPSVIEKIVRIPSVELAVTVGRDEELRGRVNEVVERENAHVEVHGWTPRMPELLMTSHILIGKAGGAAVQEAIAARTPMLITHVVPGQEEGNARLLLENECGVLAQGPEGVARALDGAMGENGKQWREWERNITRISRPDAARCIAESILAEV